MKILGIYCTPVRLEGEELIAIDDNNRLLIRDGDNIYASNDTMDRLDINSEFQVSSAGYYPRDKDLYSHLEWKIHKKA